MEDIDIQRKISVSTLVDQLSKFSIYLGKRRIQKQLLCIKRPIYHRNLMTYYTYNGLVLFTKRKYDVIAIENSFSYYLCDYRL